MSSARSAVPKPPAREATYTISELAREFALTTRAIRFYEDGVTASRAGGRTPAEPPIRRPVARAPGGPAKLTFT